MFKSSNHQIYKGIKLQMYKCTNVQMYKCTNTQMYKCNIVEYDSFTYISIYKYKKIQISKCTTLLLPQAPSSVNILIGQVQYRASTTWTKFLSIFNIPMAIAFKPFILEKSLFSKSVLEFVFTALRGIPKVPCTRVFLGKHASCMKY